MITAERKKIINYVGNILAIISIYYILDLIISNISDIELRFTSTSILIFALCLIFNLLSYIILAFTWKIQIEESYPSITLKKSIAFIGLSQVGKYLPGNFGHVLARGVMLKKYMKTADITLSFIIESLVMAATAASFGVFYLNYLETPLKDSNYLAIFLLFLFFLTTPFIYKILKDKFGLYKISPLVVAKIAIWNIILVLSGGLTVSMLSSLYADIPDISFWQYTSGFALSFVIGLVMPGAPAGIGVREATFVFLFSSSMGEQVALEIILIIRLISLVADFLLFSIVYYLKPLLLGEEFSYQN